LWRHGLAGERGLDHPSEKRERERRSDRNGTHVSTLTGFPAFAAAVVPKRVASGTNRIARRRPHAATVSRELTAGDRLLYLTERLFNRLVH
jgi:hypothetical protein